MAPIADAGLLPGDVLLLLHHEAQIFLRRVRIGRVGEGHRIDHRGALGRLANRPDRVERMADVFRNLAGRLVFGLLGSVVDRDAIAGQPDLAGQERLVVGRIQPGQRAGDEGVVERLAVFQRLDGFRAVDDDVVVLVDHRRAMAPQAPVGPAAIAHRMAKREGRRVTDLLQALAAFEEAWEILRHLVEARFLDPGLAINHGRARAAERHRDPVALGILAIVLGDREPAAIFLAQVVGKIGQDQGLVREQVRILVPGEHDVGAAADIGRDRGGRPQVLPARDVDVDLDAGGLDELLGVGVEQVLVALDEL